ncbi:unnamed protein product [Macrosiphum euphorbiae]|uniref:Myb-like domain-containing protein n=1 Tax=Macrosiphum euphorbiae TaxID=13131 RepID=A0AAV0XDR1_9HEMI|nr:unnamed protein product [Macrosiphum euphorbiae]
MSLWDISDDAMDSYIEVVGDDIVNDDTSPSNYTISNSEMSSSWTVAATKLLIALRSTYNEKFQNAKKKGKKMELWLLISNEMKGKNHNFSERQCDEKWRRLLTRFRQIRDASKVSGSGNIKWQYYNSIENSIFRTMRQTVSPPRDLLHKSSARPLLEPSVNSISKSSELTSNKTPWITKFEELENEQLKSAKENAIQLNNRIDKLEKREEAMLKTQEEVVKKLEDVNNSPFSHTIPNIEMSSSWTVAATKLLIALRSTYNEKFQNTRKKGEKMELWLLISNEIKGKNHNFSERQCDEKWRRLLTRFRQVRDASKVSGSGNIKWQYYDSMKNSISPTMRQTVSPPRDLLHESSARPLLEPSVSSIPESSEFSIQDSSLSVMEEPPTSGLIQKSLLNKTSNETPSWITKFEELKNEQLKSAKGIEQLNDRLDKLEKREEAMLKTQEELVKKLEDANNIILQKLNVFKKLFNMD